MRALSLTQPWASLTAIGAKQFETRSWGTSFRGDIAIHAAKRFPNDCRALVGDWPFRDELRPARDSGRLVMVNDELPLGSIIAIARLTDCRRIVSQEQFTKYLRDEVGHPEPDQEIEFGHYETGRYAWRLEDVRPLDLPISCRGALGLWNVPQECMVRELLRHLPAHVEEAIVREAHA